MPDKLKKGWKLWRFDQIATMVNERVDKPEDAGVEYYVGLEHLDPESLTIRRWGSPSDVAATKLLFRKGDIIFGRRRVYQRKLAVAHFDGICSAHAMVLRAKPDIALPDFLPFFMQSDLFMERAKKISVGSLSPTINWKTLAQEAFALPPLDEQRRIAEVFFEAHNMCVACYDLLSSVLCVHRSYLKKMYDSMEGIDKDILGNLLVSIIPGRSLAGRNVHPSKNEYGVLKVSAVDPLGFKPHESKVLINQSEFCEKFKIISGDLIMTRANTPELVGEVCLVDCDHNNLMLCDKTLKLETKSGVDSYILWESLQSDFVRQQILGVATGTGRAMKNMSQQKISNLIVAYPKSKEVRESIKSNFLNNRKAIKIAKKRLENCKKLLNSYIGLLMKI